MQSIAEVVSWLIDGQLGGPLTYISQPVSNVCTWFPSSSSVHSVSLRCYSHVESTLLIRFPIFLQGLHFAFLCWAEHLVAAPRYFVHPHDVHNVQADTGADPGHTPAPRHQVEGRSAVHGVHPAVVHRDDSNADHEKHHSHSNTIRHVGSRGLGISQDLEEPTLVHTWSGEFS